ncbi:hypothetical protein DL764_009093 [Monosporascus ibericus]|uniref:NACHT domain-containing protein n=1 Tax=Monosporascus ibericus TaxID=155417 RepID=A0A4Q4SY14_9PEZI|nr:hypothetical protein DL764_009093 [Monosporascus ibericus]
MERATDEIFPPQELPQTGGLQGESERTGPSSENSAFDNYGIGDQFNTPHDNQNISKGSGIHLPGCKAPGNVYFGKNRFLFDSIEILNSPYRPGTDEQFDPLRDCLRSLSFPQIDSRSDEIRTAAQGTCDWLLRHETYMSWAACDRGLLWIKGKPGSGKSTLLQYALDNVEKVPGFGDRDLVLKFFFQDHGTELQRTPLGLFQSLLRQFRQVSDALSELIATFQQRCETVGKPGEKWQWHPRELQRFFESSLLKVLKTRPVWLFVDALDECSQKNAVELVQQFKSLLQGLPFTGSQFRICFTCRHYPILDQACQFEICLEDKNGEDIATYSQNALRALSYGHNLW